VTIGAIEDLRRVELLDVRLERRASARRRRRRSPNGTAGRRRTLPIPRRRVVRDREEHLEDLPEAHLLWIEAHLDRLGVVGACRSSTVS
jgi:hypothetical protein